MIKNHTVKNFDIVKDRHHEIIMIENKIQELNEMFIHMNNIMDNQDNIIIDIEENINKSLKFTTNATCQIKKAEEKLDKTNYCNIL